ILGEALREHREVRTERVEPMPDHIANFPLRCRSNAALSHVRQFFVTSLEMVCPYWTRRQRSNSKPPSPVWLSQSLISTRWGTMYTRTGSTISGCAKYFRQKLVGCSLVRCSFQ